MFGQVRRLTLMLLRMIKILNHPRLCENIKIQKIFYQIDAFQIGLKKYFY